MEETNYIYERNIYSKSYEKQVVPCKLTEELQDLNVRALYYKDSVTIQFLGFTLVKEFEPTETIVDGETVKENVLISEYTTDSEGNTVDTAEVDAIVTNHVPKIILFTPKQIDDIVSVLVGL